MKKSAKKSQEVVINYKVNTTGIKELTKQLEQIDLLVKRLRKSGINIAITTKSNAK